MHRDEGLTVETIKLLMLLSLRLSASKMCLWSLIIVCWSVGFAISDTTEGLVKHSAAGLSAASEKLAETSLISPQIIVNAATDNTPVKQEQYSMILTSSSPAVLDSTIVFTAVLIPSNVSHGTTASQSNSFIYQWMNMADGKRGTTCGGLVTNTSVTFSSNSVRVGDYVMTVAAYLREDPSTIVASAMRIFTLTKNLNGFLILSQMLDYQRDPNTFSTRKDLMLTAYVHDQFLQTDVEFSFFWYKQNRLVGSTKQPSFVVTITEASNLTLSCVTIISNSDTGYSVPNLCTLTNQSACMPPDINSSKSGSLEKTEERVNKTSVLRLRLLKERSTLQGSWKSGTFQQIVVMKDPVESCIVRRIDTDQEDRGISLKDVAVFNITCTGSAPSSVCVNVTSLNDSLPVSVFCKPEIFVNKLSHEVRVRLISTKWNDVHFFVYNDVSRYHLIESFYGYDPDSVNVPALTIPVVFVVLGIIVIIIGGVYIMRLRKNPLVEVADFDFHPTLTSSQPHTRSQFSRMVNKVRSMFSQDETQTSHTSSLVRKHASRSEENEFPEDLYESL